MDYFVQILAASVLLVASPPAPLFRSQYRKEGKSISSLSNMGALEPDHGSAQLPGERCRLLLR